MKTAHDKTREAKVALDKAQQRYNVALADLRNLHPLLDTQEKYVSAAHELAGADNMLRLERRTYQRSLARLHESKRHIP
jgi:hypothetical protein